MFSSFHPPTQLLQEYLRRFSIEKSSKLAISHLFWQFHTFFHTFFKKLFYHIIRLLNCYKNIYGLHRFSIENSFILAISHLFLAISHLFFTPFSNFFAHLLIHTNLLKKSRSIPKTILKFWVGTRFCDTDERQRRTTNDNAG